MSDLKKIFEAAKSVGPGAKRCLGGFDTNLYGISAGEDMIESVFECFLPHLSVTFEHDEENTTEALVHATWPPPQNPLASALPAVFRGFDIRYDVFGPTTRVNENAEMKLVDGYIHVPMLDGTMVRLDDRFFERVGDVLLQDCTNDFLMGTTKEWNAAWDSAISSAWACRAGRLPEPPEDDY